VTVAHVLLEACDALECALALPTSEPIIMTTHMTVVLECTLVDSTTYITGKSITVDELTVLHQLTS
jgi:hypothetical protein